MCVLTTPSFCMAYTTCWASSNRNSVRQPPAPRLLDEPRPTNLLTFVQSTGCSYAARWPSGSSKIVNDHYRTVPRQLSVMRTPVALPPNHMQGEKESAMRRRRSQPRSFKENLQAEKARLEAASKI
jgi:hypothetical protein